jgi:uncharacterized protein (DUF934 family)
MVVLRNGVPQSNDWTRIEDDVLVPETGKVIVSLNRWQREKDVLLQRGGPVGVVLKSDQSPDLVAGDLGNLALVALEFPKFSDGRAFSHARRLRGHLGYHGEIRAVGQVLRDQYLFMLRCGFDTAEPAAGKRVEGYAEALREFSVFYQPAADNRLPVIALRHARDLDLESAAA